MSLRQRNSLIFCLIVIASLVSTIAPANEPEAIPTGAFAFEIAVELAASPDTVWDALTGDISGWWDHSMSGHPYKLFIETKPGGGFWEIFDDKGNGVRHAVVTYAQQGKSLRMEGPLGLAGHAILMVMTYELEPASKENTLLKVRVHASGEVQPGWPEIVQKTWRHFLFDRLVPFVTGELLTD